MKVYTWFLITILIGLAANIVFLYTLLFRIKNEVQMTIANELSAAKKELTKQGIVQPLIDETMQDAATAGAVINCPYSCMSAIAEVKKSIAQITPAPAIAVIAPNGDIYPRNTSSTSSEAREFIIQFGAGKTLSKDWEDIPGLNANIDSTNYRKIKSVQFEASMRIPTANGQMYVRLFNKTDGHPVWFSEVTTESATSVLKQSPNITLDSGNKLYQVQVRTSLSFESILDSSRIKIVLE